jgi:hypothetical protein
MMFNPEVKLPIGRSLAIKKQLAKDMLQRLDRTAAYGSLFETLWYASLPCFDVRNLTHDGQTGGTAALRYCEWKGVAMSCSAIFTMFPTGTCMHWRLDLASAKYR